MLDGCFPTGYCVHPEKMTANCEPQSRVIILNPKTLKHYYLALMASRSEIYYCLIYIEVRLQNPLLAGSFFC